MTDRLLCEQLRSLSQNVTNPITLLANAAALLYHSLEDVNWAGFYLLRDDCLELGPFQGKPACTRIPVGKGVCGTAVAEDRTLRVADVHRFPGHIACDAASASELVIPLHQGGRIVGVLDIDSPRPDRFSADDEVVLEEFVKILEEIVLWPGV